MTELKGKVAAVTGAASGIGRALALAFAREGMDVGLADIGDLDEIVSRVESLGVQAYPVRTDDSLAAASDWPARGELR